MSPVLQPLILARGTTLGDEVYEAIGAAILDGRLPPGEQLRDVDLAAQLGVSRTPVREALQRLERLGLVEIAVGKYTRVSVPDDRMRHETTTVMVHLLGNALRLALDVCSDEEHGAIAASAREVAAAAERAVADEADGSGVGVHRAALFDASVSLFQRVTHATANAVFIRLIREIALAVERNLSGWDPLLDGPLTRVERYRDLCDRIDQRDSAGAELALRALHGFG